MKSRFVVVFLSSFVVATLALLLGLFVRQGHAAVQVKLVLLSPPDQPVGTTIVWRADSNGSGSNSFLYRFSVGLTGSPLAIVRDFDTWNTLEWTPLEEGTFNVKVTLKDINSGEVSESLANYNVTSRVTGSSPIISSTAHPLVALYSAPPCGQESQIRVRFRSSSSLFWRYTPWKPCTPGKSENFYIAGMQANTNYLLQQEVSSGTQLNRGPLLSFKTSSPTIPMPVFRQVDPWDSQTSLIDSVLLYSFNGGGTKRFPVATDLNGKIIWYYDKLRTRWHVGSYLTNPVAGGTMLLILCDYTKAEFFGQVLREIGLAGNLIKETNVGSVNEQLTLRGEDPILVFHHEAVRLPNGQTLVIGAVERVLRDEQGPGDVHVLGDMIIALDENLQVMWTWNSFDHLDTHRAAVLGETCSKIWEGCDTNFDYYVNDWTHTNTITYSPVDGNLIISMRNQDWVIKIAYLDGIGSGDVIWRLGKDGDFTLVSGAPYPWFSHQHGVVLDGDKVLVFDNGNTRCVNSPDPGNCHSRGQVWSVDEKTMGATLDLNADLGGFSVGCGWSQPLLNGNYHYTLGVIGSGLYSRSYSIETTPSATSTYIMETQTFLYRSFRMRDLYTPSTGSP